MENTKKDNKERENRVLITNAPLFKAGWGGWDLMKMDVRTSMINAINVTAVLELSKVFLEPKAIISPIVAFLIVLGGKLYMSPNIHIRFLSRNINPDNYQNLKSFIGKYGNRYRHLEVKNSGKIDIDFWVDSCKYIDENGKIKERDSKDYPKNYNMQIPPGDKRVQIPALWDPNIEFEKAQNIIWRIKSRDVLGFKYCSCRVFKSKNGGVSTDDGRLWHKKNISWLFHRKCRLFGGCLYDRFPIEDD